MAADGAANNGIRAGRMGEYVQFPLSASALRSVHAVPGSRSPLITYRRRKWTRFADKGGIGTAVGALDKLAEPDSNQLMFMEGEHLVVLMHLGRLSSVFMLRLFWVTDGALLNQVDHGIYLGCCEGVVGVFQSIRFHPCSRDTITDRKLTVSARSISSANSSGPFLRKARRPLDWPLRLKLQFQCREGAQGMALIPFHAGRLLLSLPETARL